MINCDNHEIIIEYYLEKFCNNAENIRKLYEHRQTFLKYKLSFA